MPLFSIITPCYNGEKYIAECINSVLNQTIADWEMLIIDDCSNDGSANIVKQYVNKDCRIKYLKTKCPSGSPTLPRNIGIKNASGRFLAFLDCDDYWSNTKLEEQLSLLKSKECAIVFSNYEKISSSGEHSGRLVIAPDSVSLKDMFYGNPIGCLTVVVDTSVTGKFQFKNMHHEDCIAWIELLKQYGPAYNTNTVTAYYRETLGSVSRNKLRILKWQWNIYRDILGFSVFKSGYCYLRYAYNGFKKSRI